MHLAQNHHQRTQKTGEIGQTEVLILAFRLILPSQIVPRCGKDVRPFHCEFTIVKCRDRLLERVPDATNRQCS
jgi:hypothetical protein